MRRLMLLTILLTALMAGLSLNPSFGQGPLTNALNLMVRTDSNGSLLVYGVAAGAQGPLRNLGNTMLRTYTGGLAVAIAAGSTITAPLTLENAGLVTTSTDGLVVSNATAATSGVPVQQSPRLRLRSNVWNTTATAANNTNDWWMESVPVSGTTPSGLLKFGSSLNGGAASYPFTFASNGTLTIAADLNAGQNNVVGFNGRSYFRSIADGQLNFLTNSLGTGFGIDVNTDAVAKFRTRAQTGYATVDALGYRVSGVVGAGNTVAAVVGYGDVAAATNVGTASIATYTVGAADGTFEVSANCLVTTATAHTFSLDVTYTDESNVARTFVLPVTSVSGTFLTSGLITNITGAGPYEAPAMTIRAKAATAITVRTSAGGTFTTVVYNARGTIKLVG